MNYIELNSNLDDIILELMNKGYKKTIIAKLLLGHTGSAPIIKKFINNENSKILLGIKPLSRIGELINYDLNLVFIKQNSNDNSIREIIENENKNFLSLLKKLIMNYIESDLINKDDSISSVLDNIIDNKINAKL